MSLIVPPNHAIRLKEIGFELPTYKSYQIKNNLERNSLDFGKNEIILNSGVFINNHKDFDFSSTHLEMVAAPTLWDTLDWLDDKGFYVYVKKIYNNKGEKAYIPYIENVLVNREEITFSTKKNAIIYTINHVLNKLL